MPLYGTLLDTMEGSMTHKKTTCTEEEISIVWRESRQCVKGMAIDSNRYGCRKDGTLMESEPVGVMVISHLLNYPNPLPSSVSLYLQLSQRHITGRTSVDKKLTGLKNQCGIDKDYWGRHGMPRDRLQPNTDDLIPSGTALTKAPIQEQSNTYLFGTLWIFRRAIQVKRIKPRRNNTPIAKETYP
jgi:hypothetical protein